MSSQLVGFLLLMFAGIAFYFVPTIYAIHKKRKNKEAIFLLNLFLGWTLLGWVVALVWSAVEDSPKNDK